MVIILFLLFGPNIIFIGIAFLAATLYLLIFNIHYAKELIPELHLKKEYFNFKKIITIFTSGIWNTVTKIGQVLADGLDLLVCNWFVDGIAMGKLAVAKTVSSTLSTLNASLSSIFHPKMTYHFAKDNLDEEIKEIKFSMKIGAFFTNILMAGIIAFGLNLFELWIPTQDIKLIYYATVVTIIGSVVGSSVNTLFNVFTVTNKLKLNSIVTFIQGFLNVLVVYLLLKLKLFPGYEIVLISGISVTIAIVKNLTFTPIYAAVCLNVKKTTFYKPILLGVLSSFILTLFFIFVNKIVNPNTWISLIISAIFCGGMGVIINYFVLFNRDERTKIFNNIKLKRKEN